MYRILSVACAAILCVFCAADLAAAAPGELDPTFGVAGVSNLATPTDYSYANYGLAIQPDGKIISSGDERFQTDSGVSAIQRFNADGSLDSSFGGGDGIASVSIPGAVGSTTLNAVAVLTDGSIIGAGFRPYSLSPYYQQFLLVKFTSSGALDSTFDGDGSNACAGNGIVCTQISASAGQDRANSIAVQADGNLVVAGTAFVSAPSSFAAARYTPSGSLDSSFDGDGKLVLPVGSSTNYATAAMIQSDQKIVLAGVAVTSAPNHQDPPVSKNSDDLAFVRLNTNGSLDSSFDGDSSNRIAPSAGNGKVIITPRTVQTYGAIYAATLAPDGKIVGTGYANDQDPSLGSCSSVTVRLTTDGSLDQTFGVGGRVLLQPGPTYSSGQSVAVDTQGRVLIGGNHSMLSSFFADITRLTSSGAVDPTWAGGTTKTVPFSGDGTGSTAAVKLQPDGKLILLGSATGQRAAIARFLTDPDPPVNPPGKPAAVAKIKSPSSKSLKALKLKSLSGTAGPAGLVKKVDVALQRKDAKLLKKKKKCSWLKSAKAKFKSVKATKGKCSKPSYLGAKGTDSWKYSLTRTLPKGSYVLTARVTLTGGQTALATKSFKLK
jgi:uncharacterized delta-60 repeat protein